MAHLGPAVLLVHGTAKAVRHREVSGLHGLEFAVGAVFVALVLRHWFRVRYRADRAAPHGPEWLELAAAGILGLEGYHLHHRHALAPGPHSFHVLPWLYGAVAVGYALLAFHPAWLVRRRGLRFTPDGFWLRRWALGRARRAHWAALRAVVPVGTSPHTYAGNTITIPTNRLNGQPVTHVTVTELTAHKLVTVEQYEDARNAYTLNSTNPVKEAGTRSRPNKSYAAGLTRPDNPPSTERELSRPVQLPLLPKKW